MKLHRSEYMCKNCGHGASRRFVDDICPRCGLTDWRCGICGYIITDTVSCKKCPECGGTKLNFTNITAYIPDWVYNSRHGDLKEAL